MNRIDIRRQKKANQKEPNMRKTVNMDVLVENFTKVLQLCIPTSNLSIMAVYIDNKCRLQDHLSSPLTKEKLRIEVLNIK